MVRHTDRYLVSEVTQMVNFFGFQSLVDFISGVGFLLVLLPNDHGTGNGHPALWRQCRNCPVFVAARFLGK